MTTPTQKGYSVKYYNNRKSVSIDTCGVSDVGLYGGVMRKVGKKRRSRYSAGVVAMGVVVLFAVSAFGNDFGYTSVASPPGGEKNHAQILQDIYDGTFTKSGVNYSNGTISARRAYDFDDLSIKLNLLTHTLDGEVDQIWTDGEAILTAKAKYASLHQSFGWNGDSGTGTTYYALLTQEDIGNGGVALTVHGDFLWGCWPTQRYEWKDDPEYGGKHWYDNHVGCWHRDWPSDKKWWSMEFEKRR